MKQKCFPGNLKIKIFYSTSQIFRKYNHQTGFLYNDGGLCLQNSLSVLSFGFCLLLGLSVSWLVVMFGIWFVCLWVGGLVWYLVCVSLSWGLGLVLGLCVCGLVSM